MSNDAAFVASCFGGGDGGDLSDYLLPFSAQEEDLAMSLCRYGIGALEQAAMTERTCAERIKFAELAHQAFTMALQLSDRLGVGTVAKIRSHLSEAFCCAHRLAMEHLEVAHDLLNSSDQSKQVQLVGALTRLLEEIIRSDKLDFAARDSMTEPLSELTQAANRVAVEISSPGRYEFGWVHDDVLRVAGSAHSIAVGLSWTLDSVFADLRAERKTSG